MVYDVLTVLGVQITLVLDEEVRVHLMNVDAGLASGDRRRAVDANDRRPGLGGLVERSGRDHDVVNLVDSHPQRCPRVLRARGGRRGHGGRVGQAPKDKSI